MNKVITPMRQLLQFNMAANTSIKVKLKKKQTSALDTHISPSSVVAGQSRRLRWFMMFISTFATFFHARNGNGSDDDLI